MSYIPHWLVSFRGDLGPQGAPVEEFAFGIRMGIPGVVNPALPAATQAAADEFHEAFKAYMGAPGLDFIADVATRETKLYEIGANGRIIATPLVATGEPTIGTGTRKTPWQCAIAVTLFTGGLGKGRFGRYYLPPTEVTLGVDGTLTDSFQTNHADQAALFVEALNDIGSTRGGVSAVVASKIGVGTNKRVTSIRVGQVVDTQRRRRRSLDEAYAIRPIAP